MNNQEIVSRLGKIVGTLEWTAQSMKTSADRMEGEAIPESMKAFRRGHCHGLKVGAELFVGGNAREQLAALIAELESDQEVV